jgi:hypothetical protein
MVSGFFTSPKDHERMSFGDARVMRTEEKSLTRSYTLSAMWGELRRRVEGSQSEIAGARITARRRESTD